MKPVWEAHRQAGGEPVAGAGAGRPGRDGPVGTGGCGQQEQTHCSVTGMGPTGIQTIR